MITATFHDTSHYTIEGHANFDNIGKDIICAGVSAMALHTTIGLEKYSYIDVEDREGFLDVYVVEPNSISKAFVTSFFYAMKDLSKQYPNHIKLKGVKVL